MKKIFLVWLFLCWTGMVFSQIILKGIVLDAQTGEKLSGAHVRLEPTYLTTITDNEGVFTFTGLKAGNYRLVVTYVGYETLIRQIHVIKDETVELSMVARPVMGEEVIIQASRVPAAAPRNFVTLERSEIRRINLGMDIPYLLETTPSIVTTSDAGAGIGYTALKIRGTDLTRINVTINGVQFNDPESQGVFWVDIPDLATSVESIQIERGVGTSSSGAATFGGSINIQTQTLREEPYAELALSGGSFNTLRSSIAFGTGFLNGQFTIDGRLSRIYSDGYIDRAFSDLKSLYLSAGYSSDNTIARFILISGSEKTYQAWNGVPYDSLFTRRTFNPSGLYYKEDGSIAYYDNETDNYWQDHYQLHLSRALSRRSNLNLTLFAVRGYGYYENYKPDQKLSKYGLPPQIIGNDTIRKTDLIRRKYLDNYFYGVNLSFNDQSLNRWQFTAGGGFNYYDGDHFGDIIWAKYAANIPKDYRWYENNGIKRQYNLFAKVSHELKHFVKPFAEAQLRVINFDIAGIHDDLRDLTSSHNYTFINPKAGVLLPFSQHHESYISFGMAHREPTRSDIRDADETNQPRPEQLTNIEAGHVFTAKNMRIQANLYYMYYKDQLVLTGKINNVGAPIFINVPESYRVGLELITGWRITPKWHWDMNLTLSQNKIRNFVEYVDNWDPPYGQISRSLGTTDISFSPSVVGNSILSFKPVDPLMLSLISKYVGKQYIDNTSNDKRSLDPYFVNDLRVHYTWKPQFVREIDFSLMVNNLFNEKYITNAWIYRYISEGKEYQESGWFPQAGTHFLAGVVVKF